MGLEIASQRARLPRQIVHIIGNEACERFSFHGMSSILTSFLVTDLLLYLPAGTRVGAAKDIFHTFVMGVYFFPLLGGYLADRFFGKYHLVFWMSLVYCLGHVFLVCFEHQRMGFFMGLGLIALGAGGIKPLVSSFVGDQFDQSNKHLAKLVFDVFYWTINFGSFFASFLVPITLKHFGAEVAFGIPGVLMFLATMVFWFGRKKYVMLPSTPPDPHSFSRVMRSALLERAPRHGRPGLWLAVAAVVGGCAVFTWLPKLGFVVVACLALLILMVGVGGGAWLQLDRARVVHPDAVVDGVRNVLLLLLIFALTTPFYALFDQKGSTWILQGRAMSVPAWLHPAQMQALNPLLVMLLIPFNNLVLYPRLRRRGWELRPLRRMTFGIVLGGLAWVVVGGLQLLMDGGSYTPSIAWQVLPYILLTMGEVLVSATGLEFVYSQAPVSMKGVVMGFWNLVSTIANLWVLLVDALLREQVVSTAVAKTGLSLTAFQMFFFAAFALIAALVFGRYARSYHDQDNYRAEESMPSSV